MPGSDCSRLLSSLYRTKLAWEWRGSGKKEEDVPFGCKECCTFGLKQYVSSNDLKISKYLVRILSWRCRLRVGVSARQGKGRIAVACVC